MQQVKYFLRTVGEPRPELGIQTSQEVEAELEYKYLSQGWEVRDIIYVGSQKSSEGNELGYRLLHILVKYDEPVVETSLEVSVPAQRGRPRKPVETVTV